MRGYIWHTNDVKRGRRRVLYSTIIVGVPFDDDNRGAAGHLPIAAITEGEALSLAGINFSDPTLADVHQARIDWGDRSTITSGQMDQDADRVTSSHIYTDSGIYTVTVTVNDQYGGADGPG